MASVEEHYLVGRLNAIRERDFAAARQAELDLREAIAAVEFH